VQRSARGVVRDDLPMRPFPNRALLVLLCLTAPAAAWAARGVATASIVVPVAVAPMLADTSPAVSVVRVRDGVVEHVTVAFN